jgi:hypothetical protein
MDKFRQWYLYNQVEITWFLIGWLALSALYDLGRGAWLSLLVDLGLIWLNLALNRR